MHRSGHWYFTLKDSEAQIRVAMFRYQNQRVKQPPAEGDQVIITGKLSIYAPRGNYQLIAETLESAGLGALLRQFEALKAELQELGWFSQQAKQALPPHPRRVAIITSPQAAAFADMRTTFARRDPGLEIILLPVAVQGNGAAAQIAEAMYRINSAAENGISAPDAIIVGRGGGSLEDLWAFNERIVAEAIFHSKLPVVSAIGHESDFTIADLVADCRAPTPTAAAELLSVNNADLANKLQTLHGQLINAFRFFIELKQHKLEALQARLKHPGYTISLQSQRLDHLDTRLSAALENQLDRLRHRYQHANQRILRCSPEDQHKKLQQQLQSKREAMIGAIQRQLELPSQRLQRLSSNLNIVSPLATLARGYTISMNEQGQTITQSKQLNKGDKLVTKFSDGSIDSIVS